ncbi:MAG: sugar O-acetyltransferase [Prevotella sp.]|jgi:acetyltransferase-like isoleucine patch superfamily enzyme|nr:sugar O-acetyltransferase [Prevotella sp.]
MKEDDENTLSGTQHKFPVYESIAKIEQTKEIIRIYNNLLYSSDIGSKTKIIKKLFGKIGYGFKIEQPFHCTYGHNIFVGNNFYANTNCELQDISPIIIGDNVMLGSEVRIYTIGGYNHIHSDISPEHIPHAKSSPVTIGKDVWIGGSVIIFPGVTIGDNAFILPGSIVTKNIPKNAVASGNPAKIVKYVEEV